ncbi:winged helix-turn-helix transcriptional regulator [Halococcoides cellulosivorans]|uniref:Transcriptional regulator n=1 Tax=Halococcoides cellulosivorans TaxID=1679096 RepID=A0A2R4WYL4_9EURY|nr:helix-turn-helix domain-containing protein [Halococcoides cellulosivorans]AWB26618.1 transcriptional regulator [Halococcoides cellulosivorans]
MGDDRLAVWCAGEEWCPVTATATVIGKKWHPAIVHRLLAAEPLGFNALQAEVGGISGKVLSEALEDLEEKRIVERRVVEQKPVRVEYSLTDLGRSLEPVVAAMGEWGTRHLEDAADPENAVEAVTDR